MPNTAAVPATDSTYAALRERYLSVRAATEALAAPLSPEDQTVQSMPDVSPTKWHRAHTTWFFETFVLGAHQADYERFHPDYAFLFNSYYEGVGARFPRARRGHVSRPGAGEIAAYRTYVDEAMASTLDRDLDGRAVALIDLGLNHEQQHQELLLMDIKHVLAQSPLESPYLSAPVRVAQPSPPLQWISLPGGIAEVGHDGTGFAFDNESPRHRVALQPFAVADRPVTAGDWVAFIDDGGYRRAELWLSDGWAAVQTEAWEAPLYWASIDGDWTSFTLAGRRSIDPAEPVCHISYYEADAFARWADARLPTEAEWETWARRAGVQVANQFVDRPALHPRHTQPSVYGEVWEWTASAYLPYPGFRPAAGAVGEYNGKFMVNQHVLRGGCCATPAGHARTTYRNFFPPSARWPFTGARLARDG
ncbi:MAG: hypothetical protein QOC92_2824 [Acidimicrobiaceae bacterium]|jgi:ergothioneine biosynthesis protein EgtB